MRVDGWKLLLGCALLGGITLGAALWGSRSDGPERLILIVVDTLRRDHLSVYGAERRTPHIDAIAERGLAFPRLLASYHQTSMSMAALFTGRTPSIEGTTPTESLAWNSRTWCGLSRFTEEELLCVPSTLPTLAERLREAGYWTMGIASNEFLYEPSGFSRGFDDWVEVGEKPKVREGKVLQRMPPSVLLRSAPRVNAAAFRALDDRPRDRFFLYVHYMDAHDYGLRRLSYQAGVAAADEGVGHLLRGLERRGLLEDSVVVLTADHGERLDDPHPGRGGPNHLGNPSFQEVLEIPLLIAPAPDARLPGFLRSEDVHELIQNLAGLEARKTDDLEPEELFVGELFYRTYLRGRWKSTVRREDGEQQLFDLVQDPGETRNVAADHPEVVEVQRRRIEELTSKLGTGRIVPDELSPLDRERLRALGYLDESS
ncbi:MAG: sulfatase [Myxococcota bacterium]